MAVNIDRFAFGLAQELADCLCPQLALTVGGPTCRCCVYPGAQTPADACCNCGEGHGMGWVRVDRIFPSAARFPNALFEVERCPLNVWAVVLELGAFRCAAGSDPKGNPPSCERLSADAEVILDDAAAMRAAINCCLRPGADGRDIVVGEWRPISSGGCVGGSMTVTVAARDCCPE